jgi:hypothetical protein
MDKAWIEEEQRLWNRMMDPSWGKRRPTTHSLPPGPDKDHVLGLISKQRERDFGAGWRNYDDWINH